MNRKYLLTTIFGAALLLFAAACTNDELTDGTDALPEGKYPLQIASVTMEGESSAQPWGAKEAQTRVSENEDGMGSEFQSEDAIAVSLNGETATYTYDGNKWTSNTPIYWQNKQSAPVTAWYPTANEIDFTQQDKGLTYLLEGKTTENADYNTAANLTFTHRLAKVRVVLTGSKKSEVATVTIYSYPKGIRDEEGKLSVSGTPTYYPMNKATYNGTDCWEACIAPGKLEAANSFQVAKEGGDPVSVTLTGNVTLTAGQIHTITLTVKGVVPDDAQSVTGDISDNGNYVVRGTRNETINITGGSPNIYLDGASINVGSGCGISITGGTPTIHVVGKDNKVTAANGAGIYVAQSYTVTITGNGREDVLTAEAGVDAAGIGGCSNEQDCGSININNVTVIARSASLNFCSPGIGSTQTNKCGDITIDNATVHAYGGGVSNTCACPGIGAGLDISGNTGTISPNVTIKNNSEVHAHRGNNYADYIGISYFMTSGGGQVRATIDQTSVVMKYTGDGNTPDQ